MKILLALVPLLALVASIFVYRYKGRREILRLDSVQFFFAFILMPVIYVWFKSFLFFLLHSYAAMTTNGLLFWDTVYSIFFLFLYAFIVIHSLTKSFKIKKVKDPLYDLFEHTEYFHAWVSHTIMFGGAMLLFFFLATINAWIDLPWLITQPQFYGLLVLAAGVAGIIFKAFLISDFGDFRFMKLMKLLVAIFMVLCVVVYAIFEPSFSGVKTMYWFQFTIFLVLSIISIIVPSEAARGSWEP